MRLLLCLSLLAWTAVAREVTVTVLATTDLHGNIYPYDYFTGKPVDRGLAKVATIIANERKQSPNTLLIDCGDTIQGQPIEGVYQSYIRTGKLPLGMSVEPGTLPRDPMMQVMNYLHYDSMTVGNHEYNFGLKNLDKARWEATFPWISANTKVPASSPYKPFAPYLLKTVDGVKVGIIGITTPTIASWEKEENFRGFSFVTGPEAVEAAVRELKAKQADIIIVAAHAGLDRDLKTGVVHTADLPNENMVYQIATRVPGIDAIVFGHTHAQLEEARIGEILLTQPKNWGISLDKVTFQLASKPEGGYRVVSKSSRLLPVTANIAADPEVLRIAKPYHEITEKYLNTVVGQSTASLDAQTSRVEDSALLDAVQQVQLYYAKADVSFTSSFNPRASMPKGPVTVRQVAALYLYDNELYTVEGNGQMVKDALENAAQFYLTCPDAGCTKGPLINREVIGFNYDMAAGVTYDVDLTKPRGQRIENLQFHGKPLPMSQRLKIALNNYRAAGSGGYTMFKGAKVLWRSFEDIRELILRYYADHKLPSAPDNNWKVVPEAAHLELLREVRSDTRPLTQ